MHWEYTPYELPLGMAAVVSAVLALSAWRRRPVPSVAPFTLLMLAVTAWSLGYALELRGTDLATKVFWASVQYMGIVTVSVAWPAFVLEYTGLEKWITRRNLALLSIEPLVMLLLVWTNDVHGLVWSNVRLDISGPFPMLDYTYGAGFWVHTAYSYVLILLCTLLLIYACCRSPRLYRGQAIALLIGALVPWVGNALYIFDLSPFSHLDLTPFAFTLTGLAVGWGSLRFRLLDIVPVARDAVIEGMGDGVIVLDAQARIVDFNPAAQRIIGRLAAEAIGQPAAQVLSGWPDLIARCGDAVEAHAEIALDDGEAQRHFDLRVSPLYGRGSRLTGRLIVLRDITERKRAEEFLQKERETFFSILQKAPYGVLLIDEDERCLYINPEFTNITGYTLDDIPTVGDWFREAYPDPVYRQEVTERWKGDTAQRISRVFSVVCGEGEVREVEFRPTLLEDSRAVLVLSDITERKRAEERLRTRGRFLECLSEVAQQLLRASDLTEVLPAVLRHLGETAGVSRAYLFENHPGSERGLLTGQRHEWCAPGIGPQVDEPDLQDNFPYIVSGFACWVEILKRGGVIAGAVADFPESERAVLESHGIRSILVIPLFVSNTWCGFIGFDVCDRVREWQHVEIDLLRAAASDIASAIEREQARRRAQALAEAAAALTSTLDFDQVLDRILEQVSHVVPNDATNIMLIEGDQARIVRWRGYKRFGAEEFVSTVGFHVPEVPNLQQIMDTGEPMVVPDVATCPNWIHMPAQEWLRSYATAPIVVRGQVIGLLNADSATPGFFTQAHVEALRAFADYAAAAIENARLFEAARQRVAELEAVRQASLGLTSSLELEAVLEAILEGTFALLDGARNAHVFLYQDQDDCLTFGAALWANGRRGQCIAEPRPHGLTYTVARQGEPILVPDMRTHPLYADAPSDWEGSIIGLPLKIGQRVVGVMNVSCEQPKVFSEAELRVLHLLADQAAIAIENARLFRAERQQTRRLALLADVARIVATTLDADALLQAIAESIRRHFAYPMVELFTMENGRKTLTLRGYSGISIGSPEIVTPGVYRQSIEQGIIGHVACTGKPYFAPDVRTDPYFLSASEDSICSELCVPVFDEGRVVGVVDVESDRPMDFGEEDQSLLEAVADTVAMGLRNTRLYEEIKCRVRELTLLNRISAGLGVALNVDMMVNGALEGLHELVGAERTYFVTADPEARTWETTHELVAPGIEPGARLSGTFDDVPVELDTVLAGQPFAVFDIATDPRVEATREMYRSLGVQSILLVPVRTGRRLHGLLGFAYGRQKHVWQPDEIRLVEGVAHQMELAMENARLFEEVRLRADELAAALARQEELDRLKSEFIQNVSHELRTPLALIRGHAEMLDAGQLGELQPRQREPVTVIARRARMLSDLVRDITLILEAEVSPPEPEPVPLDALALTAVEDFQVAAEQAGLTLHAEIAPCLPPVGGSHIYMRRVLDNLLGNAIKFTPAGGSVTVRMQQEGEQVALAVSDTGVGIPAERLGRIFERFYQVDGSARRRYGGVGLGLALVKEIVEAYGGRMLVKSRVDEGSTFTVFLPIAADADVKGE